MKRLEQTPERITNLNSTAMDIVVKLSDGNPGAVTVLMKMLQDPMNLLAILLFDTFSIYGSNIWIAYKDYAKEDINVLISALRDPEKRKEMINVIEEAN